MNDGARITAANSGIRHVNVNRIKAVRVTVNETQSHVLLVLQII